MKKILILLLTAFGFSISAAYGQVADGITYQAVALDDKGKEIAGHDINGMIIHSKEIAVRFSILKGSMDGEILYQETHETYTDQYGLFSLVIGHGDVSSKGLYQKLLDINWGADKLFLSVEIDIKAKGDYKLMGIQQMMAVPFAFHSLTSSKANVNYSDIAGKPTLSTVATSGSYNDLTNKPALFSGSYNDLTNKPVLFDGTWANISGKPATLAGYGITNGMSTSHPSNGITTGLITAWNTAFVWGNHAGLYKPISYVPLWNEIIGKPSFSAVATSGNYDDLINKPTALDAAWSGITGKPSTLAGYGISDGMSTSHAANGITSGMIINWISAFNWGNHAGLYRPYSYVPTWVEITGKPSFAPVSTSGNYNDLTNKPIIFDGSWANVSGKPSTLAGYGITDAVNSSSPANSITSMNISNWNVSYSWGNHAAAGYQPFISPGSIIQFWRGDKTWQTLNKAAVGLGNVENTQLSTWTGSTNLTTLGVITSGTWNAGSVTSSGAITASSFVRSGGTSSQFLKADGSVDANTYITTVMEAANEFTASAGQTSFTLTHTPLATGKVKMFINGIRISNTAYTNAGNVLTYNPTNNGSYLLVAGDRIQFDYSY